MLEIQEQIQDYRWVPVPSGPSPLHSLAPPLPCGCLFPGRASVRCWCTCVSLRLRTKRTLGLGSLYGENDLLELDGDSLRERQVAEKQLVALGDIL